MSTSKYFGKLAAVLMAAAVLLVTVLSVCPEAVGVTAAENEAAYASLFDPFSVMEIDIAVDEDDWQEMLDNALAEEYISCDLTINGTTYSHVGVRPKGNTSLSTVASTDSDRFSFKFEFDHYVDGQTCEGLDKFVVNNIQSDSTWMKEYLSYQILTELGVPTPLYCYAHITVNGEEWGLYLAVEALEDSFAERVYGLDHGQLYKVESMDMGGGMDFGDMDFSDFGDMDFGGFDPESFDFSDSGFGGGGGMGFPGSFSDSPFGEDEESASSDAGFPDRGEKGGGRGGMSMGSGSNLVYTDDDEDSYASIFENSVFDSTSADHQRVIEALRALSEGEKLETYIDVDEVLRYIAANAAVVNLDSYFGTMEHNYYLYEEDGQLAILPWDYNLSFAGFQSGDASSAVNFPIDTPVSGTTMEDRPLISQLLAVPEYLEQYHAYLRELVDGYFNSGVFLTTVETIDELISPYVQSDPTAFYTYEEYREGVETLKEFGLLRAESIEGQLNGSIPSTDEGQQENPEALVDTGDLSLTAMGSQGGGGTGDRGGMGGFPSMPGEGASGETGAPEETPSAPADNASSQPSDEADGAASPPAESPSSGSDGGPEGSMTAPGGGTAPPDAPGGMQEAGAEAFPTDRGEPPAGAQDGFPGDAPQGGEAPQPGGAGDRSASAASDVSSSEEEVPSSSEGVPDASSPDGESAGGGFGAAGFGAGRGGMGGGGGGFGGQSGSTSFPGASSSSTPLLLAVTAGGAALALAVAKLWPRRKMQRGLGK